MMMDNMTMGPGTDTTSTTTAMPDIGSQLTSVVNETVGYVALIGLIVIITGYLNVTCWSLAAERQTRRIRSLCFKSVLKQHIGWFDVNNTREINTRLNDDIEKVQGGIGDKFSISIQYISTFVAGYVVAFVKGWKLALVILSVAPLIGLTIAVLHRAQQRITAAEQAAYAKAGSVAEEVLASVRTVFAFSGEKKECARYESHLEGAEKHGKVKALATGFSEGLLYFFIFCILALAFWYGSKLVRDDGMSGGNMLQVFFGVLLGTMMLGQAAPNLENIGNARGAAGAVYKLIDMTSEIDSSSTEGTTPNITGNIEFKEVEFSYPARPDVQILHGLNLSVKLGSTVALVGPSGCGKSTTIQLLQRFYDPAAGKVEIDGHDTREMNVKWLRGHIGVVSQEPVLFAASIAENIRYGREGVTQAEIEQATKEANAYDFISQLPEKFETVVGERGTQLSGGQKQRIAIARALVRNPKILLLDEATSALDTESEATVQAALDKASTGRTTLVIAHRLSTIRNADVIVGIKDGKVVETGTHDDLMNLQGMYYSLVLSQTASSKKEKEAEALEDLESDEEEVIEVEHKKMPSIKRVASLRRSAQLRRSTISQNLSDSWSQKEEEEIAQQLPRASSKRILQMNAPEWPYIVIGCLSAIVTGGMTPAFAVIFSEIIGNFANPDLAEAEKNSRLYAGVLVGVGLSQLLAYAVQGYTFAVAGEALTKRMRSMAFATMLRQEIGWFDLKENQVGALTARLATDASLVRGGSGQRIGLMVQAAANMVTSLVIAFVYGWKLAFVVLGFLPLLVISGIVQGSLMKGFSKSDHDALEEGGKIAVETIDNIRTVVTLTKEDFFFTKYHNHFESIYKSGIKKSHIYGFFYGFTQGLMFFVMAAAFGFGAFLVNRGEMDLASVYKVFATITFGGQALGRISALAPDAGKAQLAAAKLFALFDRKTAIDSADQSGKQPSDCKGKVTFEAVKFRYPTRQDVQVLKGLDLTVSTGQTLALVGSSGCGKSTTIQLLERFYDPGAGHVHLDGCDTRDLNIQWLRKQLGIVSQEPSLFDASIRENIAYGDNSRDIPMDEIIAAARNANIHEFITKLPQGYDTNVGDKGTQLSGGQKQRIAIARALLRNPKVLLLDEATSALDTESEKIVQEALDKAQKGRTCIVIAHRLSTIQNSDIIAVIHKGKVVEQGTHSYLLGLQGFYYRLHRVQNRVRESDS